MESASLTARDRPHLLRSPCGEAWPIPACRFAALPGTEQVGALSRPARTRVARGPADGLPDHRRVGRLGDVRASGYQLDRRPWEARAPGIRARLPRQTIDGPRAP